MSLFAHLLPKFPFATAAVIKDLAVLSLRGPKTLLMKEWGAPIVPARRTLIVIEGVATAAFSSVAQCKTDFPTIKGNLSPLHFEKEYSISSLKKSPPLWFELQRQQARAHIKVILKMLS